MTGSGLPDCWAPHARAWPQRLAHAGLVDDFYLAGSAAIAIHCGHRRVWALDWMSPAQRLKSPQRRDLLQSLTGLDAELAVETARDGYLSARAADGTGLRFFYYPYPLVAPTVEHAGCEVASRLDLALMKLAAIISRGTRRDFVDLYLLLADDALERTFEAAESKFGHVIDFPLQAMKGLADRPRAEHEPMPALSRELAWSEVEAWLDGPVRDLARRQVGLPQVPE